MEQRPDQFNPPRLSPAMSSQRLRVLDFVRHYIGRWGYSPSHGEIGAGLDIDRGSVRRAIKSLVRGGLLIQRPGARGLTIPDAEADALRQLRALGWTVNPVAAVIAKETLLPPAALDYHPPPGEGPPDDGNAGTPPTEPRRAAGAGQGDEGRA